jgi:putative inorganic carbon (hco3(-)) transporter
MTLNRCSYWSLAAFSLAAVASIAMQNIFIWLAVAFFLVSKWKEKRPWDWPGGSFALMTLIFLATFYLGALLGVNPLKSFLTVHKYLTFLLLFFVGAMPLLLREIRNLSVIYVYGSAFCAFCGIGKYFIYHQQRIDSFSGDKMVFGGMLMVSLLINLALLKNKPKDIRLWCCAFLIALALVLTQTRGAWLAFIIGFSILMIYLNRKWLFCGLLIMIVSFFFLPHDIQSRIKSISDVSFSYTSDGHIDNSSQVRVLIWLSGWKIIQDHPWGVGQGNVEDVYPKYRSVHMYFEPTVPHLHNNLLQIWAQNGWLGFLAYLFWILSFYWMAFRFKTTDPDAQDLNWAFLCVFSAVLVWGLTEYTFSHQFMNVQFFFLGLQANLWKTRSS